MSLTVTEIRLKLSNGEEAYMSFSDVGWQQWGATEKTLYKTMSIAECLEKEAAEEPEMALLLGIRNEDDEIEERLEYLRGELRAERLSYGELAELQSLADHIDPSDVELLEAAGVPEFNDEEE